MKCKVCGCNCKNYSVCYNHRNVKYIDICKIHGSTDFINNQCLECKELKTPIYIIKNNKDRFENEINTEHYLYSYLTRLTKLNRNYQRQFIQRISKTSGIYGIFVNNVCLYVGQSINISNRVKQHKDNFKIAKFHLNGLRLHKKHIYLNKIPHKVEFKYYEMANKYNLSDLSFKTLFVIPKNKDEFIFNELLTYAEQAMIESYKPKYNTMAARPTKQINSNAYN